VVGSNRFLIDKDGEDFKKSFNKLYKATSRRDQKVLINQLEDIFKGLIEDPRPMNSRHEPSPGRLHLPPLYEFRKIDFSIAKGASGQIRLMYLADLNAEKIKALWVYSHSQFSKRPPDQDIRNVIENALDESL
jgi:hypothetical protein